MVKSVIYTLVAIVLSLAFFIYSHIYVKKQFEELETAVTVLYNKTENKQANREDAYAVRNAWDKNKESLHIFVPHNDISYVDYWLNEACCLIYTKNYDLALAKLEVLKWISKTLPKGYSLSFDNIF